MKCYNSSCSNSRPTKGGGSVESAVCFLGLKQFFFKVMVAAMGCVFSCFRVKDSTHNRSSSSFSTPPNNASETVPSRRRKALSSLLQSEGNKVKSSKEKEDLEMGIPKPELEFDFGELKDEAKFLKACGTLPETPGELRKVAESKKDSTGQTGENEDGEFRSWFPNTSIEKLNFKKQADQSPLAIKVCEEWMTGSDSLEQTPSSCMTERQNTETFSANSSESNGMQNATPNKVIPEMDMNPASSFVSAHCTAPNVRYKNKSVRFDCEPEISSASSKSCSSEISSQNSKQSEPAGNTSTGKPSPYPTPLKLTDEMQTPGTVFSGYVDGTGQARTRIRSQYVYPVLNPVENASQWKVYKDEDSNSNTLNNENGESLKDTDEDTPVSEAGKGEDLVGQDLKLEASLSPWLRAPSSNLDDKGEHVGPNFAANFKFKRTPSDRPILGMVAAHWNDDDEASRIPPKWWDGNGIPNSTNKYKEDQKVSWHATPFEERLEKALSEETFISQRKEISGKGAINFNEAEESDTAQSIFQSSNHLKSVVSH